MSHRIKARQFYAIVGYGGFVIDVFKILNGKCCTLSLSIIKDAIIHSKPTN